MPTELRRELKECILCLSGDCSEKARDSNMLAPLDTVLPPVLGGTFNFRTQGIQALERLKSGKTVGKIVLDNEENTAE
jgi:hypothetical protein